MIDAMLIVVLITGLLVLVAVVLLYLRLQEQTRAVATLSAQLDSGLETKHRAMLRETAVQIKQHRAVLALKAAVELRR